MRDVNSNNGFAWGAARHTMLPALLVATIGVMPQVGRADCGTYVQQWGSGGSGSGQFADVSGLATDSSGNVYVTDQNNDRVQKFDANGTFLLQWGTGGSAVGQFQSPIGVAVSPSDEVYVVDMLNSRIQSFDSDGNFLLAWGTAGTGLGQFQGARDIAIDVDGNVYVTEDSHARVQKFSSTGVFLAAWGTPGSGNGQFSFPYGISIDPLSGDVFVADKDNHRVQRFHSDGTFVSKWGSLGSSDGQFNVPTDVAVDASGQVFVLEYGNHRVQRFTPAGDFVSKWGSVGGSDGQFTTALHLAISGEHRIYVADEGLERIQEFSCEYCGDGSAGLDEDCDDGNDVDGDGCDSDCSLTACGNGIQTAGEVCDDGNEVGGDGCSGDCSDVTGNGVLGSGEECDDGNITNGDGCNSAGQVETCYACSGAPSDCVVTCGNGVIDPGEGCDDGDLDYGDGCSADGQVEDCWSCSGEPSVCTAGAQLFTTVDSTGDVGSYSSVALGSDGLPIIAYYDATNDSIKTAHCDDIACTTSTIRVLDSTVGDISGWQHAVRIIIGGDGLPFLAYPSATSTTLRTAHCDDLTCATSFRQNMDIAETAAGLELGLALGSDGYPFITHGRNTGNYRRAVHCESSDCLLRDTQTTGSIGYRYGHATVGADGLGLHVYGSGVLGIDAVHCSNLDCSSGSTTTVLLPGPSTNWISATDIRRAPDGLGFFTYHDGDSGSLGVARCANATCSSVSTSVVDSGVGVTTGLAASSSIEFAADGRARIAYYDTDDGDLRLAHCLDDDCSTSATQSIDTGGNVGRFASMVRSGGRPLIAYYDTTNGNLKAAYCSTGFGNGVIDAGEECDDGNFVNGDGCGATGSIETCHSCAGAPSSCAFTCGNGALDPGEECDDGDLIGGDGCSSIGTVETCYGCIGQPSVCAINCGEDGNLDPTFDTDGRQTTSFGNGAEGAYAVAFQPDGRIVAVGRSGVATTFDFAVARYNEDGSPDTTFSGDGKLSLDLGGGNDLAYGVAIQGDGRLVVAGFAWSGSESYNVALVRFLADGTLDTSFSGDGIQIANFGGDDRAYGVAIQPDGKIVIVGSRHNGINADLLVARFNADGSADTTFSGDGADWLDVFGDYDQGRGVALQADGRIVVAGLSLIAGNSDFSVVRYTTNGTLDTTFSGDGKQSIAIGSGEDAASAVVVQSDGRIVLAGNSHNGVDHDFALVRCLGDGSLDTTFGLAGRVRTSIGTGDDIARSLALRSDGRIVAAGSADTFGDDDFAVVRYNPDGSLDTSFAGDGRATTAIGAGDDQGFAVGIDSNGRTVVAGNTHNGTDNDFALVRYVDAACGDGIVDAGEECDDDNLAAGDCCSPTCHFEASGASCPDDGLACSTDLCDGAGACVHEAGNAGTTCRGAAGACDLAETCNGAVTTCPADAKSTALCRGLAGECDLAESCDGVSDDCPADAKQPGGTSCTSDGEVCTDDVCDGVTDACTHPANSDPCDNGTFCDGADTCAGGTCAIHAGDPCAGGGECADACNEAADNCFDLAATPCTSDGNVCTDDVCNGLGSCGVNNTATCNDGLFCNGTDTCSGGTCTHTGDPCPGTDCNTCQEGSDSCFDPVNTPCLDEPDECTNDRCDGAGTCTHPPIALAEVCNWAIIGGTELRPSKVRTRLAVQIGGGVCADKADIGVQATLDDASWALLGDSGSVARFRGAATLGIGSVATGGGCVKGPGGDSDLLGTGLTSVCCEDGILDLAGGGVINACGTHDQVGACQLAKTQVAGDLAALGLLPATQTLENLKCTLTEPCTIAAPGAFNVIDVPKILIDVDGTLTIDTGGNPDAVVIVRLARGIKSKPRGSVLLAGGAQAKNVAFFARDGSCKFGGETVGAGTLFCPNGKVELQLGATWQGSIAAGAGITLRDNVILDHVPFLGLAD